MICCKSFKILGFIMRLSKYLNFSRSPKSLYCARPILEYGSVVRNPYTAFSSNQLEHVQRTFFSFIGLSLGIFHEPHDYSHVAEALGLCTLTERRRMLSFKFFNVFCSTKSILSPYYPC